MGHHNPKERPKIEILSSLLPQTRLKDHMFSCLVEDMKRTISKLINSINVREVGWGTNENPFSPTNLRRPSKIHLYKSRLP